MLESITLLPHYGRKLTDTDGKYIRNKQLII